MERSLKDTFKLIAENKLLLPDFQREYKWIAHKQQSLLASILLKFPIGGSLILHGSSQNFAARKIGDKNQVEITDDYDCEFLLDGQQRTTTLYNALNDTFDYRAFNDQSELVEFVKSKATPLKVRWFLRIPISSSMNKDVTDVFNALTLHFSLESMENLEPNDILDTFRSETFDEKNKKGTTKWFSPFHQLKRKQDGDNDKAIASMLVDSCAEKGLLPLFLLGSTDGERLIKRILTKIGQVNAQAIKDNHSDDINKIREYDSNAMLEAFSSKAEAEEDGVDYLNLVDRVLDMSVSSWVNDVVNYLKRDIYELYMLSSLETNDIRRAIPIFCHLNEGGMPLDEFDLIAAKVARRIPSDNKAYSLVEKVRDCFATPLELSDPLIFETKGNSRKFSFFELDLLQDGLPRGYVSKAILAICSVLAQGKLSEGNVISKEDTSSKTLLSLNDIERIRSCAETATKGVMRALAFLSIRCGVTNAKKLHYTLLVQPIALALTNDEWWQDPKALAKIEYWYWVSVFSGKYLYDQSAVVIGDMNLLSQWLIQDNTDPFSSRKAKVFNNDEFSSKEHLLCKLEEYPKEAIRVSLLQFVLSLKPYDLLGGDVKKLFAHTVTNGFASFIGKDAGSETTLDDHHIIPLAFAKELGMRTEQLRSQNDFILNSPLNRVLISTYANSQIKDLEPSRYFERLAEFEPTLSSQVIPCEFKDAYSAATGEHSIEMLLAERFEKIKIFLSQRLMDLQQKFR